jgi:3-hydroxyisobutyrate dehydrogenase-like beta-hydroxyacid dehydrogenase
MGRPLVRVLQEEGLDVHGWNRTQLAPELTAGVELRASLGEAAEADVLVLFLYDSAAVADVLGGLEPHLRAGQLVIDMTTAWPEDSVARAARLAAAGVGWVDAPVSGGPGAIESQSLAIMAGGSDEDIARARAILERAGRVTHVGGPGAGHLVKLVNQTVVPLYIEAIAEALALAERCGLDLGLVRQALEGGSADSRVFQIQGARMVAHDYTPAARAAVMLKDLRMIARLAETVGLELPAVGTTIGLYEELEARGEADLDASALHKLRLEA